MVSPIKEIMVVKINQIWYIEGRTLFQASNGMKMNMKMNKFKIIKMLGKKKAWTMNGMKNLLILQVFLVQVTKNRMIDMNKEKNKKLIERKKKKEKI